MRSFDPLLVVLIILAVAFFGLTLYSILQENLALFNIRATRFFSLKIHDTEPTALLFLTLLTALVVRNQFVLSLRPRISYKSDSRGSGDMWQVRIKNAGLGAAIINRCEFSLETSQREHGLSLLGFDEVIKRLSETGLACETDFFLGNISKGFTFPPQEEYTVFEIKAEQIQKIKHLTMLLHFQGFLGGRYYRHIVLIPKVLKTTAADIHDPVM